MTQSHPDSPTQSTPGNDQDPTEDAPPSQTGALDGAAAAGSAGATSTPNETPDRQTPDLTFGPD